MISTQHPILKDVVLLGAGHAHVNVLRMFGMKPMAGVRFTLITREVHTPYSGMLPGLIAGTYGIDDAHIDTGPLARFAGARLYQDEAVGLDLENRRVLCQHRPPVAYDLLSIDIGSTPNVGDIPGAAEHAIPVKPIDGFLRRFEALRARVLAAKGRARIGVVEPLLARSFYPEQTALDVVLSGATGTVFPLGGDVQRARGLLALVGLSGLEERSFAICSEGERARVMLARALLADAPLLVLDEPAAGLDLGGRALLLDAFDLLAREHPELASITVMHHLDELPAATTHALLLRDGRAVASGELDAAITGETLSEAFGLPLQVERMNGRLYARGEMPTSSPPSSS